MVGEFKASHQLVLAHIEESFWDEADTFLWDNRGMLIEITQLAISKFIITEITITLIKKVKFNNLSIERGTNLASNVQNLAIFIIKRIQNTSLLINWNNLNSRKKFYIVVLSEHSRFTKIGEIPKVHFSCISF